MLSWAPALNHMIGVCSEANQYLSCLIEVDHKLPDAFRRDLYLFMLIG